MVKISIYFNSVTTGVAIWHGLTRIRLTVLEQLVEKYEPLTEKLEAAVAEAKQDVDPADPQAKPAP